MSEIDLLRLYPRSDKTRSEISVNRSIIHRIVAAERDFDFFDGHREFGYGGLRQDFRWDLVASDILQILNLSDNSTVLQVNCEKGYLLQSFSHHLESNQITGTESSQYAISQTYSKNSYNLVKSKPPKLPFKRVTFDLVISLGNVYTLSLKEAIIHLREIERVKRKYSFITLATYETAPQLLKFKEWSLLGNLILKRDEWKDLMKYAGYTGYYSFIDSDSLSL
jgi:hypothetical protein